MFTCFKSPWRGCRNRPAALSLRVRGIAFVSTTELVDSSWLSPRERAIIAAATPTRAREFATGRLCAKQALCDLGMEPVTVGVGPNREPLWPPGVTGSISHTTGYCCAAVTTLYRGIGVDAQRVCGVLTPTESRRICTTDELRQLTALSRNDLQLALHVIFSAKEAIFKAVFPLVRRFFGFNDVSIEVDWMHGSYQASLSSRLRGWLPCPLACHGEIWVDDDLVITLVTMQQ